MIIRPANQRDDLADSDYRDIYRRTAQRMALVVWAKPAKVDSAWAIAKPAVIEYRRIIGWADIYDEIPF